MCVHSYNKHPCYGIAGFSCLFIPEKNSVGNPNALYLWYNQPIVVGNRSSFVADLGVGVSYNFKPYDPDANPTQTAISFNENVFYDASNKENMYQVDSIAPSTVPESEKFVFGLHASHEYMVHRWSVVTQLGINLNHREYKGNWFARVGARYDLTKNIFLRVALKVPDGFKADFIEWGGGFYLYKY